VSVERVFTGIVEELGSVLARDGSRLRIGARDVLKDSSIGASIAVNGCCLTVVARGDDWWEADVSDETYSRTNLGAIRVGDGTRAPTSARFVLATASISNARWLPTDASADTSCWATSISSEKSSRQRQTSAFVFRVMRCGSLSRRVRSPSTASA
ncbi:MAG: hypothetical protein RLZZ332_869, partial [Actinomycetota bacterium]